VHSVNVKLNTNVVAYKDVEIIVREDGRKLGTLLISRGNIEWRPAWKILKKHRLSWSKFAEMMTSEGRTIKKRKTSGK
jgi:hypothetical protein